MQHAISVDLITAITPAAAAPKFDLLEMLTASGPIGMGVMLSLLVMSVTSWGIIVLKQRHLRRATQETAVFLTSFWNASELESVYTASQELEFSPVARIFQAGYSELTRSQGGEADGESFLGQLGDFENIERALRRTAVAELTELERLTPFLATTASAAPFIGLFGTVVGIIRAFHDIGARGSANLAVVAPGISEALIVTAAGLAAAIPAVIAFNYFNSKIKVLRSEMESFSGDLLNIIKRHFY